MGGAVPSRLWAIEGAEGLGFLLAQQFVTAGETVVDVLATSAARTRVLGVGRSNINDPNDLMSVAVTALRTRDSRPVQSVGKSEVLQLLSKRNLDIGRQRSRTVSRLHALFRNRDHFAASTGAAPVEFSSGGRIAHRWFRRANRTLNAAIHLAAVTQLRHKQQRGLPRTQNQPGLTGLCHTGAEGSVHDIR